MLHVNVGINQCCSCPSLAAHHGNSLAGWLAGSLGARWLGSLDLGRVRLTDLLQLLLNGADDNQVGGGFTGEVLSCIAGCKHAARATFHSPEDSAVTIDGNGDAS